MKEHFSSKQKNFLKHFNAKNTPSEIEIGFYERAYKYIGYIKWIPGLQMIAIGNSISMNAAKDTSDIDLFIVTTNNSMWFVRIIITFIFGVLGVRKTPKKHAGRFCLSFFATNNGLNFKSWKIEKDIYLYFRILYLKPILDYNNTYERFIKENEEWADYKGHEKIINDNKKYIKYRKTSKKENGFIVSGINTIFKKIFLPKTIRHYERIGKPYGIIINDNMLKFHNSDIREKLSYELLG